MEGIVEALSALAIELGEVAGGQVLLLKAPHQVDGDGGVHVIGHEPVVFVLDGLGVVVRVRVQLQLHVTERIKTNKGLKANDS